MKWYIAVVLFIALVILLYQGFTHEMEITLGILFCIFAGWVVIWLIPSILKYKRA